MVKYAAPYNHLLSIVYNLEYQIIILFIFEKTLTTSASSLLPPLRFQMPFIINFFSWKSTPPKKLDHDALFFSKWYYT